MLLLHHECTKLCPSMLPNPNRMSPWELACLCKVLILHFITHYGTLRHQVSLKCYQLKLWLHLYDKSLLLMKSLTSTLLKDSGPFHPVWFDRHGAFCWCLHLVSTHRELSYTISYPRENQRVCLTKLYLRLSMALVPRKQLLHHYWFKLNQRRQGLLLKWSKVKLFFQIQLFQ